MILPMGSLYNYLKTMSLQKKADDRIRSGKTNESMHVGLNNEGIHTILKKAVDDNYESSVYNKLMRGEELSDEELSYLKEKNPELYRKAVRIKEERRQFSQKLKKCKSKDEARTIKRDMTMSAMSSGASNLNSPDAQGQSDFMIMRIKAIENQFNKFALSAQYARLKERSKETQVRTDTVEISKAMAQNQLQNEYKFLVREVKRQVEREIQIGSQTENSKKRKQT